MIRPNEATARDCQTGGEISANDIPQLIHQLAQPLALLTGILEVWSAEGMSIEEQKQWMKEARQQVARVNAGFNQIRNLATPRSH